MLVSRSCELELLGNGFVILIDGHDYTANAIYESATCAYTCGPVASSTPCRNEVVVLGNSYLNAHLLFYLPLFTNTMTSFHQLPAHVPHTHDRVHVVVETPKGGRNKVAFDPELGVFKLMGVLPEGHSFPYDFGFVPSTLAADGDPLDVLLLLDAPTFAGCVVEARLLGAIEIEQQEKDGQVVRNDRLLAVAASSRQHKGLHSLDDLPSELLHEIEHFFISYNQVKGQTLTVLRRVGPERAHALLRHAQQLAL